MLILNVNAIPKKKSSIAMPYQLQRLVSSKHDWQILTSTHGGVLPDLIFGSKSMQKLRQLICNWMKCDCNHSASDFDHCSELWQ